VGDLEDRGASLSAPKREHNRPSVTVSGPERDTARAMSQENVEIVREAFEAFLAGDQEKSAQLVDPEVEFLGTVGGLQEGQIAHGQSEIDQKFEAEDLEAWEERRLEPEEFIDAGDNVVVLLHEYRRGRGSGVELETETAVVVGVSGGRVVRIQGYMDRGAALEAAGLRE
jgi:ketosteroid isomerase-like protein